jgi:hypothetical protein
MINVSHPAKYSDALMPVMLKFLNGYERILDPFAGTGKLRLIRPDAYLIELEPEWASVGGAIVSNALRMPYGLGYFDAIATSPCYGNRMADKFTDRQPEKKYRRNTYKHVLGRDLHKDNSGQLQWGESYREFHREAWRECRRVLRQNGRLVLNISDHIRDKQVQNVTDFHVDVLEKLGFVLIEHIKVGTPRNRLGANSQLRVGYESVIAFDLSGINRNG